MPSSPTARILRQSLRATRDHSVIYLNNPKAGCSTVKATLWRTFGGSPADNVHILEGSPFSNEIADEGWVADAFIFTFVRNPFVRSVSAFVNKIAARKDKAWQFFSRRHGLAIDDSISFDSFVECIATDPPEWHDPHWRAQSTNTLAAYVSPNFVGALEQMDVQLPRVLARVFSDRSGEVVTHDRHRTGATEHWQSYLTDSGTVARLQEIYGEDFENFGYTPEISADVTPHREVTFHEHRHTGLVEILRGGAEICSDQSR